MKVTRAYRCGLNFLAKSNSVFPQKKAVPKAVLLSSDEDDAPSSRTRSKAGSSKTRNRERGSPRKPASTRKRDAVTQRHKPDPPVAISPQVSATPYNLRHTVPHDRRDPAVISSPQTYSTPQDLRRHVLDQQHRHHVTVTPDIGFSSSSSSYHFQRSTIRQQSKPLAREVFSTSLLSSDEESELNLSAKPSQELSRRQLRSSTKATLPPPPKVALATEPAKPTPVQKLPREPKPVAAPKPVAVPKPVAAAKRTKPPKPDTVVANGSPGWMHLGWAEFFLALVVVAIITLSLWLYQKKFEGESMQP